MTKRSSFTYHLPILAAIAILLFATACTSPKKESPPATFDMAAAQKAIDERNSVFIDLMSKGDSVGLANCYTADAKLMASNTPTVVGRTKIQTLLAGFINAGFTRISVTTMGLWGNETMLFEEAAWVFTDKDGKVLDRGKQIDLWKMEDGKWKIFRDCFNSDLPCLPSK